MESNKERMNIVIVGHVDHGKSTVIGRLLADTGSLPQGKLESVRAMCAKNARPFEYAFLLDALEDEQDQGITIDTARCFFKTERRHYIVLDAPGHIEFLKNMVTGAASAEAALLVIDAKEGVKENSKRHGYLVSMLGIKKLVVLVNKMDLVDHAQEAFEETKKEYSAFLKELNLEPISFIPISAREGENMVRPSEKMPWFEGRTVLSQLDDLVQETDEEKIKAPFRFPVQDIYKFTAQNDDRRIFAGTVETGRVQVGDSVVFLPSGKESEIRSVERFNRAETDQATAGEATGFTLKTQVYIPAGELMVKKGEIPPQTGRRFRANIFWMGKAPLITGKDYKMKIATRRVTVRLVEVKNVLDASDLRSIRGKQVVERHDVGECIFECFKPIAFDPTSVIDATGRFVLVDHFEIAGGGIILDKVDAEESIEQAHVRDRERSWQTGYISTETRANKNQHNAKLIVFTGDGKGEKNKIAMELERRLFMEGRQVYYLSDQNLNGGLDKDIKVSHKEQPEQIRRLGELARIMTGAGLIFITALSAADGYDLQQLKTLNAPNEILVVYVGANPPSEYQADLVLPQGADYLEVAQRLKQLLDQHQVLGLTR